MHDLRGWQNAGLHARCEPVEGYWSCWCAILRLCSAHRGVCDPHKSYTGVCVWSRDVCVFCKQMSKKTTLHFRRMPRHTYDTIERERGAASSLREQMKSSTMDRTRPLVPVCCGADARNPGTQKGYDGICANQVSHTRMHACTHASGKRLGRMQMQVSSCGQSCMWERNWQIVFDFQNPFPLMTHKDTLIDATQMLL